SVIERPKMIYNEKTGKYIIWFHADGPTATSSANYAAASAGVAVSDSATGPFKFIDRYRLNTCPENQKDFYPKSKGMARDMNLFIDDDGTAYIIYSSEENLTLYISKLNEEYTYLATAPENAVYGEDFIRIFPGAQREAPALFKRDGKYYLMTSACTGWAPNPAKYAMADSVFGTWTDMGDPCVDDISRTTFYSQSTCIFCYDEEKDYYIYMGDRWNSDDLANSRYIWLPISFDEEGHMSISYQEEWLLPQIGMED
ncbi:MAG: family 43 glycosylhydrolase, partial [Lachnospiraceae bacterium]|nr:family 43 glycosylhydrolase [Lachnospiraceae bacterium]